MLYLKELWYFRPAQSKFRSALTEYIQSSETDVHFLGNNIQALLQNVQQ